MTIGELVRRFPLVVDVKRCEDCGAWMTTEYVHDPKTQSHWRGVEAFVCQDCGRAEYASDEPAAKA